MALQTDTLVNSVNVSGVGGIKFTDYFHSKKGLTSYLGMTTPGFPNFYMLLGALLALTAMLTEQSLIYLFVILGPNSLPSHGSVVFMEETQVEPFS